MDDINDYCPRGLTWAQSMKDEAKWWHEKRIAELMLELGYDPTEWDFECLPDEVQTEINETLASEWRRMN